MNKSLLIALSLASAIVYSLAFVGCASLTSHNNAKKAAAFLMLYCTEPEETRAALRTAVNAQIAPNSVRIFCASDNSEGY